MSTETKIGLIVGLGFIVCFAVLLANTDPERKSAVQWTHVVDGITPGALEKPPRPGPPIEPNDAGSRGVTDTAGAAATHSAPRTPASAPSSPRPERTADAPRSAELNFGSETPSDPNAGAAQAAHRTTDSLRDYLDARRSVHADPPVSSEPADGRGTASRTAGPADEGSNASGRAPISPLRREPAAVDRGTGNRPHRHVVVVGDTLTRIAANYYGSRSRRVVEAVYHANRKVLRSADELSPGTTLELPALERFQFTSPTAAETAGAPASSRDAVAASAPRESPATRWYQIRKDDRYVSIARTQLGDAARWREIYELNRDRFPDPERIQWGVRIRLPGAKTQTTLDR